MKSEELLKQLGEVLNIELSFTENGYCSVRRGIRTGYNLNQGGG